MGATASRKPEPFFYPAWIVLSAISILIGFVISLVILKAITAMVGGWIEVAGQRHITEDFLGLYVWLPSIGVCTGVLQYLLLRRYLPRAGWWIPATFLGWTMPMYAIGLATIFLIPRLESGLLGSILLGVIFIGGPLGLGQWLVLRGNVPHAIWWILFNLLGWGLAGAIVAPTISTTPDVVAMTVVPPVAASAAWWLMLDRFAGSADGLSNPSLAT